MKKIDWNDKKIQYICLGISGSIFVAVLAYTITTFLLPSSAPVGNQPQVATKQAAAEKPKGKTGAAQNKEPATAGGTGNYGDLFQTSPFVDMHGMIAAQKGQGVQPVAGSANNVHPVYGGGGGSIPLPAIPNMSGSIPMPSFQAPSMAQAGPAAVSQGAGDRVSGIITGNDGSNVAIMGNGQVVSQGDNYGDGRIAYIGGDGIKLDNGRSITYK